MAVIAAALLVTGSACGAAHADPGGRDTAGVAGAVERLGQERFADHYAGVVLDGGTVVVYRRPGSGLDAAVRALPGASTATFRDAPHSAAELQPLRERVEGDVAYWAGRGITVAAVAVPPQGSGVEVTTPEPDRARTAFTARYGPDPALVVVGGGPITVPTATTASSPRVSR